MPRRAVRHVAQHDPVIDVRGRELLEFTHHEHQPELHVLAGRHEDRHGTCATLPDRCRVVERKRLWDEKDVGQASALGLDLVSRGREVLAHHVPRSLALHSREPAVEAGALQQQVRQPTQPQAAPLGDHLLARAARIARRSGLPIRRVNGKSSRTSTRSGARSMTASPRTSPRPDWPGGGYYDGHVGWCS